VGWARDQAAPRFATRDAFLSTGKPVGGVAAIGLNAFLWLAELGANWIVTDQPPARSSRRKSKHIPQPRLQRLH